MLPLMIGKPAKQTKVTIETIRHYQRIGLLTEPSKPDGGYRVYSADAITRIRFIKRAQQAGFTLKEIATLLSLDGAHCADVRQLAEQKCQQIDQHQGFNSTPSGIGNSGQRLSANRSSRSLRYSRCV